LSIVQLETDPVSETLCSPIFRIFEYWTMDKVQKPINSEGKLLFIYNTVRVCVLCVHAPVKTINNQFYVRNNSITITKTAFWVRKYCYDIAFITVMLIGKSNCNNTNTVKMKPSKPTARSK
jgi:hypothetical protein